MTPVSLFAAITEQSEAPGSARLRASRSSSPDPNTGTRMHSDAEAHAPDTAGCSTAVVTTLPGRLPRMASASDSVPPEAKITSRGAQPSARAHRPRARAQVERAQERGEDVVREQLGRTPAERDSRAGHRSVATGAAAERRADLAHQLAGVDAAVVQPERKIELALVRSRRQRPAQP